MASFPEEVLRETQLPSAETRVPEALHGESIRPPVQEILQDDEPAAAPQPNIVLPLPKGSSSGALTLKELSQYHPPGLAAVLYEATTAAKCAVLEMWLKIDSTAHIIRGVINDYESKRCKYNAKIAAVMAHYAALSAERACENARQEILGRLHSRNREPRFPEPRPTKYHVSSVGYDMQHGIPANVIVDGRFVPPANSGLSLSLNPEEEMDAQSRQTTGGRSSPSRMRTRSPSPTRSNVAATKYSDTQLGRMSQFAKSKVVKQFNKYQNEGDVEEANFAAWMAASMAAGNAYTLFGLENDV